MSDEEEQSGGRRQSSRRTVSSAKEQRKRALEELKNARTSGKAYRRNVNVKLINFFKYLPG
jgi:hypothetical protein